MNSVYTRATHTPYPPFPMTHNANPPFESTREVFRAKCEGGILRGIREIRGGFPLQETQVIMSRDSSLPSLLLWRFGASGTNCEIDFQIRVVTIMSCG